MAEPEGRLAVLRRRVEYAAHPEDHGGLVDVRRYVDLYARDVSLLLDVADAAREVDAAYLHGETCADCEDDLSCETWFTLQGNALAHLRAALAVLDGKEK